MSKKLKTDYPRARVLNLVGVRDSQIRIKSSPHIQACKQNDLPYIKVYTQGGPFIASLDMFYTSYWLTEEGVSKALELREGNYLMIWAKHQSRGFITSIGRKDVMIECLSEEIALATADALALLAAAFSEPKALTLSA